MNNRIKITLIAITCIIILSDNFAQTFQQLSDSTNYYSTKGDFNTAMLWAEKSLQQAEKEFGKKDTLYANTLTTLVELSFYIGNYEIGIKYSKEEITIRKEVQGENHLKYANSLNNLAILYHSIGRYPQSEEFYLNAKEIRKKILGETHPDYANSLNNLAMLYRSIARYPQSEELFLISKDILKTQLGANHPDYAFSLNNMAGLYHDMGRYTQSEELFLKSKEIVKISTGENHPNYAASLNNLASLYCDMECFPQAEELYLKSKEIYKTALGESHPYFAIALDNLAELYQSIGRYPQALEFCLKSKEILKTHLGENHPDYAISLDNLAVLYTTTGKYSEAEELYLISKNILKNKLGETHPDYATTLKNLAEFYEITGNYKEANTYFQQAIQKNIYQINAYFSGMSEKEKSQFFKTIENNFEHYYSFGKQQFTNSNEWAKQMPANIFNYRIVTKGLLFNSSNKMRENILTSNDTSLIQLFRTWKSKRDYLAKFFTLSKEEIEKQDVSLEGLQKEINDMEKELSKKSVLFDKETEKKEITWQDVQSQLKEGEAFVEMIRFRKYGTITDIINYKDSSWFVKKDGFTDTVYYAALILTSKIQLPKLIIIKNGNELEEMYYGGYKLTIKHFQPYHEGYTQYWEKIAKELQGIKTVYFCADGVYNQINLNTLQNPQTGKYLLEEVDIRLITSSKDLLQNFNSKLEIQNSKIYNASLYGYVNYSNNIASKDFSEFSVLPGTKTEVENIEELFKEQNWQVNLHRWDEATEGAVKKEQDPVVLHIATHGYFLSEENIRGKKIMGIDSIFFGLNPLLKSGLLLAVDTMTKEKNIKKSESGLGLYGKEEDGILTAYEAMNLNLDNTELVVLSACETGLGNQIHGEGVFGLQRAFQQAGAKSVIMSLWKVSDKHTQELMSLFYTNWLSGLQKSEAFKKSQEEMKNKYVHPYYWGGFVLVGD